MPSGLPQKKASDPRDSCLIRLTGSVRWRAAERERAMNDSSRGARWENIYRTKGEREVSWFQETPSTSLDLIRSTGATRHSSIVDIGGGASRLVDALVDEGYAAATVLDVSESALAAARARLGPAAATVTWIVADVVGWKPLQRCNVWHDRAAFHFLTEAADRTSGVPVLRCRKPWQRVGERSRRGVTIIKRQWRVRSASNSVCSVAASRANDRPSSIPHAS
jgi:SAM-dependent methyltransferase